MDTPCTRFVILGHGRTGSTLLVQALNSNAHLTCFGEIFNSAKASIEYGVPGYEQRSLSDLPLRDSDPDTFMRDCVFSRLPPTTLAVGFKFHYDHFWTFPGLMELLAADRELRVVHLMRRNRLRTLVSMRIAESTGRWLEFPPEPSWRSRVNPGTFAKAARDPRRAFSAALRKLRSEPPPGLDVQRRVTLDITECRDFFQNLEFSEQHWTKLMAEHPSTDVFYEDLASDLDVTAGSVQQFLGLEPVPVRVDLQRQNPEPLRQLISNYDELRASFAGTPYEPWFDD